MDNLPNPPPVNEEVIKGRVNPLDNSSPQAPTPVSNPPVSGSGQVEMAASVDDEKPKSRVALTLLGLFIVLASIPAAVYLAKQRQEIRKEAYGENCSQVCSEVENPPVASHESWCEGNCRCINNPDGSWFLENPWCEDGNQFVCSNGSKVADQDGAVSKEKIENCEGWPPPGDCNPRKTYSGASGLGGSDCKQGDTASVTITATIGSNCTQGGSVTYDVSKASCACSLDPFDPSCQWLGCGDACGFYPPETKTLTIPPGQQSASTTESCHPPSQCGTCQVDIDGYGIRRWENAGCPEQITPTPPEKVGGMSCDSFGADKTTYKIGETINFTVGYSAIPGRKASTIYVKIGEKGAASPLLSYSTPACATPEAGCLANITAAIPDTPEARSLIGKQADAWVVIAAEDQENSCSDIENRSGMAADYPACGNCRMSLTQPGIPPLTPTPFPALKKECRAVLLYDMNWELITNLDEIKITQKIYMAVSGAPLGKVTKGRFRVNGGAWMESIGMHQDTSFWPALDLPYTEYTIVKGGPHKVEAEIYYDGSWY